MTVDDPKIYTKRWTVTFPMVKSHREIDEYACHESNYGMFGMLAGARAEEKAAAHAAKERPRFEVSHACAFECCGRTLDRRQGPFVRDSVIRGGSSGPETGGLENPLESGAM